jgi:DNA-directed RNA polymerase sigma subunit (sigma70/sigma32)
VGREVENPGLRAAALEDKAESSRDPTICRKEAKAMLEVKNQVSISELLDKFELSDAEKCVIKFRYGIECTPRTHQQMRKDLRMSVAQIRQVELHALRLLRHLPSGIR